jgi:predicted 3-demethylubiquinone-9 3-methyltransferase (glyoxalase superfamily)
METHIQTEPVGKTKETDFQKITPFLWIDNQTEEAVNFYTSIFNNSKIKFVTHNSPDSARMSGKKEGSVLTISFQIEGQEFTALNGGTFFKINPSISFFVHCDTPEEIDRLWSRLSAGGDVLMALDRYPFNEKYGWVKDKFGVSWQLILMDNKQKLTPCLLFTGEHFKQAEEAINFYISIFRNPDLPAENSGISQLQYYQPGQGPEGAIIHARFKLNGQEFIAMDSNLEHNFNFTPAISFVVNCKSQEEIDYYWNKLSESGVEEAQQCGWLADKFGVSWQIVPDVLGELLSSPDPARSGRVLNAILQMKKIDIKTLQQAYEQQ